MSGGVDSSVAAALLAAPGPRRHRRHPAALRPWRGGRAAGLMLRRPGHPRRPPRRRPARHPALRPRLRAALQGDRHAVVRRQLRGRRDADSVCDLQPADQVPASCSPPPGSWSADLLATGHYIELRRGPAGPELYRARDADRDQSYFLFATTPRPARLPAVPARRLRQGRGPRASPTISACPLPTSPTARTSASSRRAATPASSSA